MYMCVCVCVHSVDIHGYMGVHLLSCAQETNQTLLVFLLNKQKAPLPWKLTGKAIHGPVFSPHLQKKDQIALMHLKQ